MRIARPCIAYYAQRTHWTKTKMSASVGEADGSPPAKKPKATVKAKGKGTKGEDRAPDDDSQLYGKDKNDPVIPYVGMPIGNASCAQITTWAQMCCLLTDTKGCWMDPQSNRDKNVALYCTCSKQHLACKLKRQEKRAKKAIEKAAHAGLNSCRVFACTAWRSKKTNFYHCLSSSSSSSKRHGEPLETDATKVAKTTQRDT
jgi:hypothetical protein